MEDRAKSSPIAVTNKSFARLLLETRIRQRRAMYRSDGAVYSPTGEGEYLGDIFSVFTREAPSTSTRRELLENVLTEITTVKSVSAKFRQSLFGRDRCICAIGRLLVAICRRFRTEKSYIITSSNPSCCRAWEAPEWS